MAHEGSDMTAFEWNMILPRLPNKRCGVRRVGGRRVLNGIFHNHAQAEGLARAAVRAHEKRLCHRFSTASAPQPFCSPYWSQLWRAWRADFQASAQHLSSCPLPARW